MKLTGKTALVTGANRGIGRAIVETLLTRDVAKVYAAARNPAKLPDFGDDRVVALEVNLDDLVPEHFDHVMERLLEAGALDVGIQHLQMKKNRPSCLISATTASWRSNSISRTRRRCATPRPKRAMSICSSTMPASPRSRACCPASAPTSSATWPSIISARWTWCGPSCRSSKSKRTPPSSTSSRSPRSSTSRGSAALYSLSQGIRIELAPRGITVHTVNPGPIDTDMAKDLDMDKTSPQETAKNIVAGLENDEADIFPDAGSRQMIGLWKEDYRQLEQAVYSMHHGS